MDLLRSHKTGAVRKLLKKHDVTLSMVPGGCTGLVQPLDVSVNRPFKDILKQVFPSPITLLDRITNFNSQAIEDELDKRDADPADIQGSSAVGEMRVLMTRCVGEAWSTFCRERQEVVVKSFRQLGISLPIDGSCDSEISVKGLSTERLMAALTEWKTCGAPSGEDSDCEESDSESESEDEEDDDFGPLELIPLSSDTPDSPDDPFSSASSENPVQKPERGRGSGRRGRPRGSRARGGQRETIPITITNDDSLGSAASSEQQPVRGRGSGRRGRPRGSRAHGGRTETIPIPITDDDSLGSAASPEQQPVRGRGSGRRGRPRGSRARGGAERGGGERGGGERALSRPTLIEPDPESEVRRSGRLAGQAATRYREVLSDTEDEDEDDGIEFGFRWQDSEEF
jgi:hypothetical protein